jgi:hypothetical protein
MHPWTLNWDSSAIRSTLPQRGQLGLPKSRVTGFAALQANWMVIADSPRRFASHHDDLARCCA